MKEYLLVSGDVEFFQETTNKLSKDGYIPSFNVVVTEYKPVKRDRDVNRYLPSNAVTSDFTYSQLWEREIIE